MFDWISAILTISLNTIFMWIIFVGFSHQGFFELIPVYIVYGFFTWMFYITNSYDLKMEQTKGAMNEI